MDVAHLRVRAPFSDQDCVHTADAVFDREGFVAAPYITGPSRFYTPRAPAGTSVAMHWGIAVNIEGGPGSDTRGQCIFELQPLAPSADEECGISCSLTPQPGYNDITRKMAGLLNDAFRGHSEK